ncbi:unnamed protein product [Clonostachys rosea]|uniref:Uncharacterized protein n=1 Tax=Bionectria ochroleuca TaxID=29856 RepID=A0ABY6UKG4_BIOOC|nr:unnamed protein product [Clonostachys rosea]
MASHTNFYINPDHVHLGGWTNWNGNTASGGQITMGKNQADLLNIFIGIFLVFVGAGLWKLIAFFGFDFNRRHHEKKQQEGEPIQECLDGLFHQQQTVLRNGGSDIAIGVAHFNLWKAWRGGIFNAAVVMRTWPVIAVAFFTFTFFLVALPFTTALVLLDHQGDEILVKSPNCGFWAANLLDDDLTATAALTNSSLEAVSYVDNCYEGVAESSLCDRFLTRRSLPIVGQTNAECPFDKKMCLSQDKTPGFYITTEVLDSHEDFGINAPPDGRIKLQRMTTCAPLAVSDFSEVIDGTLPDEQITAVDFGPAIAEGTNYTHGTSNYQVVSPPDYYLRAYWNMVMNSSSYSATFSPIQELQRTDADVTVIFLNNNLIPVQGTQGPCRDPFFSATQRELKLNPGYYWPDNALTAIGCADQYIFGNPITREWTQPGSIGDATGNTTFVKGLTKRQAAAYSTLAWSLGQAGGISTVIAHLETEALRAKKYPGVFLGFQNPIPNDQWKREVEYWFKIGLAKLQLFPVHVATGPADLNLPGLKNMLPLMSSGRDDIVDIICSSQKVHNMEFKNFHRAGFIVLVFFGGLLIIVPTIVTTFIVWRWRDRKDVLAWTSYGQLQLLRMATEGAGVQGWQGCNDDVPFQESRIASVGSLEFSESSPPHPKWVRINQEMVSNESAEHMI